MLTKVTTYEKDYQNQGKYRPKCEILVDHKIITLIQPSREKGFYDCHDIDLELIFTTDQVGMRLLFSKSLDNKGFSGIDIERFTD